ncbi:hypothetical protein ACHAWF_009420 [Thalassiosira exigua]
MNAANKRTADRIAAPGKPSDIGKKSRIDGDSRRCVDGEVAVASAVSFEGGDGLDHECPAAGATAKPIVASAKEPDVLTFASDNDSFARLQLLSSHTLYHLVSTLCHYTPVGDGGCEGPNDHMWHFRYKGGDEQDRRKILEDLHLETGSTLTLVYDYGSTSTYQVTLLDREALSNADGLESFPRNHPKSGIPASYQKYQPNTGTSYNLLDVQFFYLNDWIFHNATSVSVHLFQTGRKKNYGFMNNKFTMMYLPAKPDDLANWLECFNRSSTIKPAGVEADGYTHYTWQSVVALPESKLTDQLRNKYKSNERHGFCDAPIIGDHARYPGALRVDLDKMFPKTAALAGLRKDKRVPKGWISFTRHRDQCSLRICKGNAQDPRKSKAPKGLAFEGENQHDPIEGPLFQISGVEIRGLQDLFCVVEGLLMTL